MRTESNPYQAVYLLSDSKLTDPETILLIIESIDIQILNSANKIKAILLIFGNDIKKVSIVVFLILIV